MGGAVLGARAVLLAALLGVALLAWLIAVETRRGMDAGPGNDLGSPGWLTGPPMHVQP